MGKTIGFTVKPKQKPPKTEPDKVKENGGKPEGK